MEISVDNLFGEQVSVAYSKSIANQTLLVSFYEGEPYIQLSCTSGTTRSVGTRMTVEEIDETILALEYIKKKFNDLS